MAWVTLGTFHIPHSEDIPIVQTPGVELKFVLLPFNFFDEDPSLASRDNVRSTPRSGGGHNKVYAGVKETVTCSPVPCRTEEPSAAYGIRPFSGIIDILIMGLFVVAYLYFLE